MRYMISGLLAGLLVGALAPLSLVFGVTTCDDLTWVHSSGGTCCQCGKEDNAVDKVTNSGDVGALLCICVERRVNTQGSPTYAPTQCQSVGVNLTVTYTVLVDGKDLCEDRSWDTDIGFTCIDGCDIQHPHLFEMECGDCD